MNLKIRPAKTKSCSPLRTKKKNMSLNKNSFDDNTLILAYFVRIREGIAASFKCVLCALELVSRSSQAKRAKEQTSTAKTAPRKR